MSEKKVIVHCSGCEYGHALMIEHEHTDKGRPSMGHHYVIMNGYPTRQHLPGGERAEGMRARILNGDIEIGRTLDAPDDPEAWETTGRAYGYKNDMISVCLVGAKTFTREQIISLVELVKLIQFQHHVPTSLVIGHSELPNAETTCPNLDMERVRELVVNKSRGIKLLRSFDNVVD